MACSKKKGVGVPVAAPESKLNVVFKYVCRRLPKVMQAAYSWTQT